MSVFQRDHAVAVLDEAIGMLREVIAAGGDDPHPGDVSNLVTPWS